MRAALVAALLVLPGCASIVNGTRGDVAIRSDPSGASFEVRDRDGNVVASGETPASARLERNRSVFQPAIYQVVLRKPGYLPKRAAINTRMGAWCAADWVLLLLGGLVDGFTGGCWNLEEPPIQILSPEHPFPQR